MLLALCGIYVMPEQPKVLSSAVSGDLPVGWRLLGWYGVKTQETEAERSALASDTKFSKAIYTNVDDSVYIVFETAENGKQRQPLPCMVSVVFSGNDMHNSIHRPERCLPAQGHFSLNAREMRLRLADGHVLPFTRLSSMTKTSEGKTMHHIHYYVFVGDATVTANHLWRTLYDIKDRIFHHKVQQWAYVQLSVYYGDDFGVDEKVADAQLIKLTQELLPKQIDWQRVHLPQEERREGASVVPKMNAEKPMEWETEKLFRDVLEM